MAKKKDRSELEQLRGLNRQLTKKVKQLQKQVGRRDKELSKTFNEVNNFTTLESEERDLIESPRCSKCKSAQVTIIDLKIKEVLKCHECCYVKSKLK